MIVRLITAAGRGQAIEQPEWGAWRICTQHWAEMRRMRTGSQSTQLIAAGRDPSPCCTPGSGPAPGARTSGQGTPKYWFC